MSYQLVVTERAKQDRDRAFAWLCDNISPEYAARWYNGIALAIESLRDRADQCHKAHENDRFPFELFELLRGSKRNKHRVLFRIVDNSVVILHIRHSARRDIAADEL